MDFMYLQQHSLDYWPKHCRRQRHWLATINTMSPPAHVWKNKCASLPHVLWAEYHNCSYICKTKSHPRVKYYLLSTHKWEHHPQLPTMLLEVGMILVCSQPAKKVVQPTRSNWEGTKTTNCSEHAHVTYKWETRMFPKWGCWMNQTGHKRGHKRN